MEDTNLINFTCRDCEHPTCNNGKYYIEDSTKGCVRVVPIELYSDYYHQVYEEWPFMKLLPTAEARAKCYKKTYDIIQEVLNCPKRKK